MTCWTIVVDNIAEPGSRPGSNSNAVGLCGPSACTLTHFQIASHKNAVEFHMGCDGEWFYEGFLVGDDLFAPKDDFGEPNAGCTDIEVYENGEWVAV